MTSRSGAPSAVRHDRGGDPLAEAPVRDPDHGGVRHRRNLPEHLLDVRRVDVRAAPVDDVAPALAEEEVAVGVDVAVVAGVEHPALKGGRSCRGAPPVPEHRSPDPPPGTFGRGRHTDLTGRARCALEPVVAPDRDLEVGHGSAARALGEDLAPRLQRDDRRHLAQSVRSHHPPAESRFVRATDRLGQHCSAGARRDE